MATLDRMCRSISAGSMKLLRSYHIVNRHIGFGTAKLDTTRADSRELETSTMELSASSTAVHPDKKHGAVSRPAEDILERSQDPTSDSSPAPRGSHIRRRATSFNQAQPLCYADRHLFTRPITRYSKEIPPSLRLNTPTYISRPPSYFSVRTRRPKEFEQEHSFRALPQQFDKQQSAGRPSSMKFAYQIYEWAPSSYLAVRHRRKQGESPQDHRAAEMPPSDTTTRHSRHIESHVPPSRETTIGHGSSSCRQRSERKKSSTRRSHGCWPLWQARRLSTRRQATMSTRSILHNTAEDLHAVEGRDSWKPGRGRGGWGKWWSGR
jgi:hypothetical protein